jgi:signal transduction histidine kinase
VTPVAGHGMVMRFTERGDRSHGNGDEAPVRTRIIGVAVWCSVLAIVLFGLPLAVAVVMYAVQDAQGDLTRSARSISIEESGNVYDEDRITDVDRRAAEAVAVFDEDGNWLGGDRLDDDWPELDEALDGQSARGSRDGQYVVAVPITHSDETIGAVVATRPQSAVWPRILLTWAGMAALAALAVASAWLVGRRQARRLAAPLEDLAEGARRLGEGDFSVRSRPGGVKEIDSVGAAMDSTAVHLDDLLGRERAFSADASHQLRTPLAGLRLRLEAALEQPDEALRSAVTASLADADRLQAIIEELLTLARDRQAAGAGPVDPAALVDELTSGWRGRLALHGRDLDVTTEPGIPQALASGAAVRQVLAVLVDNATTHGAGTVRVRIREAPGAVAIDVSDDGRGVSEPAQALFARRADQHDGHGIGLALARRLAEAEQGRLVLTQPSPPVFTLLLPAATVGAAPGHHAHVATARESGEWEVLQSAVPPPRVASHDGRR